MRIKADTKYPRLKKAIADELMSGAERVRQSYREEIVRTAWNIGRILRGTMGLEDRPSAENAALIARLSKDLGRSDSFFYDAAKFHRLYPSKAPAALSWSHYSLLIRLENPQRRLALEKKALAEGINANDLRMYTRLDSGQIFKTGKSVKLSVERGCLYHYRASNAPVDGRVLLDIGFGIERDVRCNKPGSFHSGLIVRTVRIGPGLDSPFVKGSQDDPNFNSVKLKSIGTGEDYSAKIATFDKARLYTHAASLERVIDGDTLIARVDLGFRTWITQTFRLRGIDAPEITCVLGQKAKTEVKARLDPCSCLVIKTYKQEKYGRFLADVFYLPDKTAGREHILSEGAFLNQELLDEGLAVPYLFL